MHDTAAGGHPLQIALAKPGTGTLGIRVVDIAPARQGHGLKPAMGMLRKARDSIAVAHGPAVLTSEILANGSSCRGYGGAHMPVARWIRIIVMGAK